MTVIVVGSGIVGASAAYQLAKDGQKVVVVDGEFEGKATAAGAEIVCPWITSRKDQAWYSLALRGARFYTELITQLKEDGEQNTGYKQVGAMAVHTDHEWLDEVEKEARAKQADAPEMGEIQRLTAEATKDKFPLLKEDLESVFVSGAARVDGRLLQQALLLAAQKHGARYTKGKAELISTSTGVKGVKINGEEVTGMVLAAAGAWTRSLLKPLGIDLAVEPQRGQIAHIHLPEEDTSSWPVILPASSHYMLAFDDARVVAGATRETGSGFDYRTTAGGLAEVTREALNVAPGLADGTLKEMRIGFRPMSPDGLPLLGPTDEVEGLVVATGLGASGLTMGPYVGKLAASLAKGIAPEADLAPYVPDRAFHSIS
ncbi:NAD(P)/FAD-dependent oxidoreductase [Lentibacillus sediminis]|uniref:NAD(P)/FAD-dependent oxidoreductase n=1 Tax=Lentibacillus sediminis TaxID=1940529 RepID=UPI000C1C11F8|nr:FAD-dependent oxidoreductase [Lentibacillus sediminis]